MFQSFIYDNSFCLNVSFPRLIHHPPSNIESTCYINRCVRNVGLAIWITISWKENFHTNFCISTVWKRCKGACPKPSGIRVVCLSLETWLMLSNNSIHIFCSGCKRNLEAPYVKATCIVLSTINHRMLSNISKNDFFLDKVQTNFFPLRSCRWFDNNRFTSLTLPVMASLNFSLLLLSLVGNDISTVQYPPSGPLSESDIANLNQVLL